jgi:hypothetical protein
VCVCFHIHANIHQRRHADHTYAARPHTCITHTNAPQRPQMRARGFQDIARHNILAHATDPLLQGQITVVSPHILRRYHGHMCGLVERALPETQQHGHAI